MAALIRSVLAVFLLCVSAMSASASEKTIVILDGSGSMWAQIGGKPKLQVARDTLKSVLQTIPANMELGLMAYGHRQKGSCEDIELVVPPAAGSTGSIAAATDTMQFLGKTPLSAAVRKAAEDLKYTEEKATIVLITDGLETCNADPCAVAKELEQGGADLTVHVVGFGLSEAEGRQVACLAENTGGKYIRASDAAGLKTALEETVVAAAPPPSAEPPKPAAVVDAEIAFVAVDQQGKRVAESLTFSITDKAGGAPLSVEGTGEAQARLEAGTYEVAVSGKDIAGGTLFTIASPPVARTIEVPVEIAKVETTLDAPATAPIASTIEVSWNGPGKRYDEIQLFNPRGPNAGEVLQRKSVVNDELFPQKKVSLVMAARPGMYELRYNDSEAGEILATRPIEVVAADVSLTAPDRVQIGKPFAVEWVGPAAGRDDIEIFDPAAASGQGEVVRRESIGDDPKERKVTFDAPAKAGDYQLRYWNGDNSAVLFEKPLKVFDVEVTLDAASSVPLGSTFKVKWEGPAAQNDEVQIFDEAANAGAGEVLRSSRIVQDEGFEQKTVSLIAPAKPGKFQLRYWNGEDNRALAMRPIEVTAVEVSLDAPASVSLGTTFDVKWEGPGARYDEVQIFDESAKAGAGEVLRSASLMDDEKERTVALTAPARPGTYQLRYWNGEDRRALATRVLEVAGVEVSLDAPASIDAGNSFKVKWVGPAARYDEVQIYREGQNGADGEVMRSARIAQDEGFDDKTVTLIAPTAAGSYQLRYWNGEDEKALTSRSLAVAAVELAVEAPATVDMGSTFVAGWKGPGAEYDDVQIGPPKSDSTLFSARLSQDDKFAERKVSLIAPVKPGTYELRYWSGEDSRALVTVPLEVKQVTVAFAAPDKVKAGQKFTVEWQGPGARYDSVHLAKKGAVDTVVYADIPSDSGFADKRVTLEAPQEKGAYELRYWNGEFGAVLAKRAVTVE